ncbi:hypothetical protein C9374_007950 [Naegleria lovaniensis]|uniref:Uncharacterized protein n=1 Tax=Naegleria lovaniensis TaxID=51637 RepID=A0AA88GG25_NAELO|nr:uncharacterized protein C9374_007950 [Naegleria lovaniensis]KAG2378802.1 hypothetical protein C9374_007950 [Naegleria lovaniensis]
MSLSTSSSPDIGEPATRNESSTTTPDPNREIQTLKALLSEAMERIQTLEDVCTHLNHEMTIMKKLITVQVNEVSHTMDSKFTDIIRSVDSKIMQTEQRVDQVLTRFETAQEDFNKSRAESVKKLHHSALLVTPKKSSVTNTSHNRSDLSLPPFSPILRNETPRNSTSKDRPPTIDSDHSITQYPDDMIVKVLESEMFESYKDMALKIFKYCISQLAELQKGEVRKTMGKKHFMKFFTEGKLSCVLNEKSWNSELVWVSVLKRLRIVDVYSPSGKYQLTYEQFEKGLFLVAQELKDSQLMTTSQRLESLMLHIIPLFSELIQQKEAQVGSTLDHHSSLQDHDVTNQSLIFENLERDMGQLESTFKKHRKQLKAMWSFYSCAKKPKTKLKTHLHGLNIKDLLDLCQVYGLKSLITKGDLVIIFEQRMDMKKTESLEDRLSYSAFEQVLVDIANKIYGEKPFSNMYQTTESRLEKLLSKLVMAYDDHRLDRSTQGLSLREY